MYWVFLGLSLSMCIWSFSFTVRNVTPDYEKNLFWRRIGSVGWGTMFSFFLHYILLLTDSKLLNRKWISFGIYVPAVLNILLFGVWTKTAVKAFYLVQTDFGWINSFGLTVTNWYYNIYHIGFSALGIYLLLRWGMQNRNNTKRKEVLIVAFSYIIVAVIGTMTEYQINSLFKLAYHNWLL